MVTTKQLQSVSFLVALILVFLLVAWIFKPFINILALALILAILFRPVYRLLLSKVKKPSIASLLTLLIMILIIAIPLWLFGQVIVGELNGLYDRYRNGGFVLNRQELISQLPPAAQDIVENFSQDINSYVGQITSNVFSSASRILSNVAGFFIALFMLLFIVYYLLRDGGEIKAVIMDISPMASAQESKLFDKIVLAVNGVVKGAFLMAVVQGVIATVGFLIFGVPEPFLWGAFTVLAALVPTVGTALSLVPAIIYLIITGNVAPAIGLTIWGVVFVGLVDNFLGPKLIGSSTKLHPVLVLLAVIGGIQFFGILGFLIGPIVLAIFVAMVQMYRDDYSRWLHSNPDKK